MKNILMLFTCSLLLLICSCSYGNFTTCTLSQGNNSCSYYLFERNDNSPNENLVVYLEGSTMHSALGIKGSILPWKSYSAAYVFQKILSDEFDLMVPERMNMETGRDYSDDTLRLREYTLKNRVNASANIIDAIIGVNRYKNIFIIGYSEGGLILPKVYNQLKNKTPVKKLICISAGGYSYYQLIKTTLTERGLPDSYVDSTIAEMIKDPGSVTRFAFGHPYNKWRDFLYYDPMEEYKKVDIPILVIHGDSDTNASVKSSRFLKNKFDEMGKKNLTYIEIKNADHSFEERPEQVISYIENFIKK
jgi:predicted esterase